VRPLGDGWYLVTDGGRQWRVAIAGDAAATWVFVEGRAVRIEATAGRDRPHGKSRGDGGVVSPMPASVVAVHTAPGQSVNEGDTVIVLEAMKMELPIRAPRSGRVTAVHCAQGDLVQPGVNLLEIE
jgi:3-methylcrotonyl-CoA carboxylase alpha subunit